VAYALIGSLLTYFLGRGLIHAGNIRQSREADFRSGLTRAREHAEGIALMRGEEDERERLRGSLFDLRSAWNVQTRGQGNLSLLTSSLAYLAPIVPLIVALPRYLGGEIALGGLMQTARRPTRHASSCIRRASPTRWSCAIWAWPAPAVKCWWRKPRSRSSAPSGC
jgi:putative ATP-binding cassette transporter